MACMCRCKLRAPPLAYTANAQAHFLLCERMVSRHVGNATACSLDFEMNAQATQHLKAEMILS